MTHVRKGFSPAIYLNICFRNPDLEPGSALFNTFNDSLVRHEDFHYVVEAAAGNLLQRVVEKLKDDDREQLWRNVLFAVADDDTLYLQQVYYNMSEICVNWLQFGVTPQLAAIQKTNLAAFIKRFPEGRSASPFIEDRRIGAIYFAKYAAEARMMGWAELERDIDALAARELVSERKLYADLKQLYLTAGGLCTGEIRDAIGKTHPDFLRPSCVPEWFFRWLPSPPEEPAPRGWFGCQAVL